MARTRYQVVTKPDDDHIAFEPNLAQVISKIIQREYQLKEIVCFSGLNLYRDREGKVGIYPFDPVSGKGDIGFFRVTPHMYFTWDRRFERAPQGQRQFTGYLYFHMKYLKKGNGYDNYELVQNPNSRYLKRRKVFETFPPQCPSAKQQRSFYREKSMSGCLFSMIKREFSANRGVNWNGWFKTGIFRDEMLEDLFWNYKAN